MENYYTHAPPGVDEKEFTKELYEASGWSKISGGDDADEDEAKKEARMDALTCAPTRSMPDIVINPHAIPSRMTIGHVV